MTMSINLQGKSILLGVTGSISAYKACEIARLFVRAGANVNVVMSRAAERFVSALTFEALTRNPVLTEKSESWSTTLNHIELGKTSDIFVIAPCSANTLNKLSHGIADTILTQTALAYNKPLLIAPAANTNMLTHPQTTKALKTLAHHTHIVKPQNKLLACGDVGEGALATPEEIFFQASRLLLQEPFWKERATLVTGGGTREKIDEVRYISNFSSGKMAKSLCLALYLKGANVHYITTMDSNDLPQDIQIQEVEDATQLLQATKETIDTLDNSTHPYLFMVAAVADFTPQTPKKGKLKKATLGKQWSITLKQTTDILSKIDKSTLKTIAFKAEMDTQNGYQNAKNLLETKKVDAVCYNLLKDAKSFGGEENEITFISQTNEVPLGRSDKHTLAQKILQHAKEL